MKYISIALLTSILSTPVFSKDVLNYVCPIDKDVRVELSLVAKESPSIGLFFQKSKYGLCIFENTPMTTLSNPRTQTQDAVWVLKLKKCDYYFDKHKSKLEVLDEVTFKESKAGHGNFLIIGKGLQPVICAAKK